MDDTNEDEVKENITNDLKTNFENQTNTIESIKVKFDRWSAIPTNLL